MAKAFDCLDHRFITQVYKFFGLGENMIRWLHLLGNQRRACINLEDNLTSKFFDLGCGRPQGDNLSPITFNFCEQILIFRLELDPLIAKIPRIKPPLINSVGLFQHESNRETDSNESLADDNTVITLLTRESLMAVKTILHDFGNISGLQCNYDKTVLLPIMEPTNDELLLISEAEFRTVDSIKLLGMDITRHFSDVERNFIRIKNKIIEQVRYWERFKLCLAGRLSTAKTYLVSQLNYLGCVFIPPKQILDEIQEIINNFIKKNLKIAGDRITISSNLGGLGFFKLDDFLSAQRCSWIFRAHKNPIDNWRYDLHALSPNNNVLLLRSSDIARERNPVLFGLVLAYEKFYSSFSAAGGNYRNSYIFENSFFARTEIPHRLLNRQFFGVDFYNANKNIIHTLTFSDCFRNGHFKSLQEWQQDGCRLSINTWLGLRNAIMSSKGRLHNELKCDSILEFSAKLKKGSKNIRNT
jgi:hypothetical protein